MGLNKKKNRIETNSFAFLSKQYIYIADFLKLPTITYIF